MTEVNLYRILRREHVNTELLGKVSEAFDVPLVWFFQEGGDPGVIRQVAHGDGNRQLVNSQVYEQEHAALLLCQEKVRGLETEVGLLREMNGLLKGRAGN